MSMLAARTVPHEQPGGAPRPLLEWVRRIVPAWAHRPGYFLLPVLAVALLLVLRRIDAALHQMHLPGESGGGALSFPLWPPSATETVRAQHQVWRQYLAEVSATRVAAPQTLVRHLVLLDLLFIAVYGVLLVVLLSRLYAANRGLPDGFVPARGRMLITAGFGVVLLCAIDVAEDVLLWLAFGPAQAAAVATVGSVLTIAKFAILALIALPVLLTTIAFVIGCPPVGRVLVSARAVLAELGLVVAVLLVFGLGKNQTDDVVRAWQPLQGLSALLAGLMGALVVVGVTTHLTDSALDRPRPDDGKDPQWLVFGAGLALIAAGLLARTVGLGWGLAVPGGLLILLGLLGLPLVGLPARRPAPATAEGTAQPDGLRPSAATADGTAQAGGSEPEPEHLRKSAAAAGRTVAIVLGAALLAVLIWVIARASAFDLFVRTGQPRREWAALVIAVMVLLAAAGSLLVGRRLIVGWKAWSLLTAIAIGLGLASMVPRLQIVLPEGVGSVAVTLAFVALLVGVTGWAIGGVRRIGRFRLIPVVRAVGFRRFPILLFVVVWALVLTLTDPGGYHDIHRGRIAGASAPPTLEQAFVSWRDAHPGARPRPLMIVAAQGGGMRAAVWTALVMECIFGPGPVQGQPGCAAGGDKLDPAVAGAAVRNEPLPVFLASGSSGGSVGLAAWSARRADLAAGVPTPAIVERALGMDFLAPNLARWFVGDLSYAFLAHRMPDRAEILEQAWEQPWGDRGTGLSRGLRATYQEFNGGGRWQIPVLAFNGAGVEDGCRFLTSPVDFEITRTRLEPSTSLDGGRDTPTDAGCRSAIPDRDGELVNALPVTGELVDYLCADQDVPLSTAAHLSARFPYVSPTGRVERQPCASADGLVEERSVSFVSDGGLFDNSGAFTALEAWRALAPIAAHSETDDAGCLVPIFVQIDNGVGDGDGATADRKPFELTAPLDALLGEIGSRESYARASAATGFSRPVSPAGREVTLNGQPPERTWFQISLFGQPGPRPPLGWTLSDSTVSDMRAQLGAKPNAEAISQIHNLLNGQLACARPGG